MQDPNWAQGWDLCLQTFSEGGSIWHRKSRNCFIPLTCKIREVAGQRLHKDS